MVKLRSARVPAVWGKSALHNRPVNERVSAVSGSSARQPIRATCAPPYVQQAFASNIDCLGPGCVQCLGHNDLTIAPCITSYAGVHRRTNRNLFAVSARLTLMSKYRTPR